MTIFNRKQLLEALKFAGSVVPDRTPSPVLQFVRLTAASWGFAVTGTDGQVRVTVRGRPLDSEPLVCLLPASRVQQLLAAGSDEEVTIIQGVSATEVHDSTGVYKFQTPPVIEFPDISPTQASDFKTDSIYLGRALPMVMSCIDEKSGGYFVVNGVRFDVSNGNVYVVGADYRRVCACSIGAGEIKPFTVESRVARLVSKMTGTVYISLMGTTAVFSSDDCDIVSSTLLDKYPGWKDIIGTVDQLDEWGVSRDLLQQALLKSELFSREESRGVSVTLTEKDTRIVSFGADVGQCDVVIPGQNAKALKANLNAGLLHQFLSRVPAGPFPVKFRIGDGAAVSVGDFCQFVMAGMEVQ